VTNKKILVVDDDPDFRKAIHTRLQANHYDTYFAADGRSGIAQARQHQPDLMILDLGLPAGDGFAVMEKLKADSALAAIPVIVVSARDGHENKQRALQAGAKTFLEKPTDVGELLAAIREALGN
jgi:DNA-binding response OmpR family regulator